MQSYLHAHRECQNPQGCNSRGQKVVLPAQIDCKGSKKCYKTGAGKLSPTAMAHYQASKASPPSRVLFLAEDQMARQKAILFTKSAKLYTKFRMSSSTPPIRYPKK